MAGSVATSLQICDRFVRWQEN